MLLSWLSDGWVVKPVGWNGNSVKVKFSQVEGMWGVVMQSPAGVERVFNFAGGVGTSSDVDSNGLVRRGSSPDIIFNLRGMKVQS